MKVLLLFVSIILMCQQALSINVDIDTNQYSGRYSFVALFVGGTNIASLSGDQTLDLIPGPYRIIVAGFDNFEINLANDGSVTVNNGISATGGGNSLSFNTASFDILTSDFSGQWFFQEVLSGGQTGDQNNLSLILGLDYQIGISGLDRFIFSIDGTGGLSVDKPSAVNIINGNQLQFQTVGININPALYTGKWSIPNVFNLLNGSLNDIRLLPDHEYAVQLDSLEFFRIQIRDTGNITVVNGVSAVSNQNNLTFNTLPIDIDPGAYAGDWELSNVTSQISGPQSGIHLVPGIAYLLVLSNGESNQFKVESPCAIVPTSLDLPTTTFTLTCTPPPQNFTCEEKTDYPEDISCRGAFTANNINELNNYLEDFGLEDGYYKSLKINFDLDQDELTIHSPCKIRFANCSQVTSNNLCLDGRKGVSIPSHTEVDVEENLTLLSQKRIHIAPYTHLSAGELNLESNKRIFLGTKSHLEAESIRLKSSICRISRRATLMSDQLVKECEKEVILKKRRKHFGFFSY